jgi:AcrR family transcriptional regulator
MATARTVRGPAAEPDSPRRTRVHLAPRRAPVQARAHATVRLILDTAATLLDDVGVEGFNTNALAARAGIRVRTVYRYFPNKLAVMTALAERLAKEWDAWFGDFRAYTDPNSDWREVWTRDIDAFVDGIRRAPGGLAIRRAMRAMPELRAIDARDNERLARHLAAAWVLRGVGLSRRRLATMARVVVETVGAVVDLALLEPRAPAYALIEELKRMQLAYFAAATADSAARARRRRT